MTIYRMVTEQMLIVQTLATMLMTYIQRPSLDHCGIVAKAFVTKYEFLKEGGELSYIPLYNIMYFITVCTFCLHTAFVEMVIYYHCQNINHCSKSPQTT